MSELAQTVYLVCDTDWRAEDHDAVGIATTSTDEIAGSQLCPGQPPLQLLTMGRGVPPTDHSHQGCDIYIRCYRSLHGRDSPYAACAAFRLEHRDHLCSVASVFREIRTSRRVSDALRIAHNSFYVALAAREYCFRSSWLARFCHDDESLALKLLS